MTTNHHTAHVFGFELTSTELNRPLSELDAGIDAAVADEATARAAAIAAEATARTNAIAAEAVIRGDNDTAEQTARIAGDSAEAAARAAGDTAEAGLRASGDAALDAAIDAITLSGSGTTTTLDGGAAAAQKVIPLTSTTGLTIGQTAMIRAADGSVSEGITISAISPGVSVTASANLVNTYVAGAIFSVSPVELALSRGDGYALLSDRLNAAIGSRLACQRLLKKLYRNAEDAVIVVIGDSTAAGGAASWPGLMASTLAARYPAYTVQLKAFNDTTKAYDAATLIATGSGSHTLWILNGAIAGMNISYGRDYLAEALFGLDTLPVGIAATQPDLVLISHGHNEPPGASGVGLPQRWDQRQRMNLLIQMIRAMAPAAGVAIILENELTAGTDRIAAQHVQQDAYIMAAQDSGADVIDFWQVFHDTGNVASYLADGVHPNTAGKALIQAIMNRYLVYLKDGSITPAPTSSLLNPTVNLLPNGALSQFSAPPTLPGWTATHLTLSKDVTHFESVNGYGVRAVGDGSAGTLQALLSTALSRELRGRWLTLLVRERIVAGSYVGSAPGVVNLASLTFDGTYHVVYEQDSQPIYRTDAFVWNSVSIYVDPTTDNVRVWLKPDYSAGSTVDATFDRVILVPGVLPRDVPRTTLMSDLIAAGQIPFPATQIPSSDPNVFDDYEENDWTPALKFGGANVGMTVSAAIGHYTKKGREVTVQCDLTLSAKGSSTGSASISGLPFANNSALIAGGDVAYYSALVGLTGSPRVAIPASSSGASLYQSGATAATLLTDANFGNTSRIVFTAVYTV